MVISFLSLLRLRLLLVLVFLPLLVIVLLVPVALLGGCTMAQGLV